MISCISQLLSSCNLSFLEHEQLQMVSREAEIVYSDSLRLLATVSALPTPDQPYRPLTRSSPKLGSLASSIRSESAYLYLAYKNVIKESASMPNGFPPTMRDLHYAVTKLRKINLQVSSIIEQRQPYSSNIDLQIALDSTHRFVNMTQTYTALDYVVQEFAQSFWDSSFSGKSSGVLVASGTSFHIQPLHRNLFLTEVPIVDMYRVRLWPILAHEMAHPALHRLEQAIAKARSSDKYSLIPLPIDSLLQDHVELMEDLILDTLGEASLQHHNDFIKKSGRLGNMPKHWSDEFICDAAAAMICGPAFALALGLHTNYATQCDKSDWSATHPPTCIRMMVLDHLLSKIGFPNPRLSTGLDSLEIDQSNKVHSLIHHAKTHMEQFVDTLCNISKHLISTPFDHGKLIDPHIDDTSGINSIGKMNVPELLHLAWYKRLVSFDGMCSSGIEYLTSRALRVDGPSAYESIVFELARRSTRHTEDDIA